MMSKICLVSLLSSSIKIIQSDDKALVKVI